MFSCFLIFILMTRLNRIIGGIKVRDIYSENGKRVVAVEAFVPGNAGMSERMELSPSPIASNVAALREAVRRQLTKRLDAS